MIAKHPFYVLPVVGMLTALLASADSGTAQRHCIWRVSSPDAQLFLIGSLHLLRPDDHPLPSIYDQVLDQADALALEVNLGEAESLTAQLALLARGIIADGRTLDEHLKPDTIELLRSKLNALNIDYAAVRYFKPWMLMLTITHAKIRTLGFDMELGIDRYLFKQAQARNLPVFGLETLDSQVGLFETALAGLEDELLRHTLDAFDTYEATLKRLFTAWKAGDLDRIHDLSRESFESYPELEDALITDRNLNWIPQLEAWLNSGRTFVVAVGVGHLSGDKGVLSLLKAAGYRIEHLQGAGP